MSPFGYIALGIVTLLVCYLWAQVHRYHRAAGKAETESRDLRLDLQNLALVLGRRFEIRISDWGPDFTGEDDILPRWRWIVRDAEIEFKRRGLDPNLKGPVYEDGVHMIGNSPTKLEAYVAAVQWIEAQQHPAVVVVGEDI
jgi:hypothetical protein